MFKRINEPLTKNGKELFAVGDTCNEIIGDSTNWEKINETVWDLKNGDTYYCLFAAGGYYANKWRGNEVDEHIRSMGNAFLTQQEVEEEAWRREFETKMKREFKPWECDWDNLEQDKCCLYYNYYENIIKISARVTSKIQGTISCTDVEVINEFLNNNEQDLLRYFGVVK